MALICRAAHLIINSESRQHRMTGDTQLPDVVRLFTTRIIRLFCYGFLSVVLALYLAQVGFRGEQIGLLLTLTLAGDARRHPLAHGDGRPLRTQTDAPRRGLADVRGRRGLHPDARRGHPDGRGHHRRHQPERQRDRPFPVHRAGGAEPAPARRAAHPGFRLVQPRRVLRHGGGRAVGRLAGAVVAGARSLRARGLPGDPGRLRARRARPGRDLPQPLAGRRGRDGTRRRRGVRAPSAFTARAGWSSSSARSSRSTRSPAA